MLWNVAPKTCTAKALLGSSVICRLDVDPSCRPQILEENVTPKGPKGNLMNIIRLPTPIFGNYVIGQMSNMYVGAVRACFTIQHYKLQELQTV